MKKNLNGIGILFFLMLIVIVQFNFKEKPTIDVNVDEEKELPVIPFEFTRPENIGSKDHEIDEEVHRIYLTVFDQKLIESVTITAINEKDYLNSVDLVDDFAYVHFSTEPTEGILEPNGTLEIRGQSARVYDQKSYKVKLFDDTELWEGFQILNLNKHFKDPTRFRNKLSFDLFYMLTGMSSMETKFVELYLKDMTEDAPNYEPYGLFTFIEQPNEEFLEKELKDANGGLYKAEFFEFYNYDEIVSKNNPNYDEVEFESFLEIKGNDNHVKLKEMLVALNDYNLNINDIVETYFDEENMLTWLTCNILMNNYDTSSRNYMLYNPTHTSKWYFLPWDYDKAWSTDNSLNPIQRGLSNYWGMVIFNRYFKVEGNFEKFQKVFNDIYHQMRPEVLEPMVDSYYDISSEFIYKTPDLEYLELDQITINELVDQMKDLPLQQYVYYYDQIETPMPFYLGDPVLNDDSILFQWEASFDMQNDPLRYKLRIANDPLFRDVIFTADDIFITSYEIPMLDPGTYFWKVEVFDDTEHMQVAFDLLIYEGKFNFGAKVLVLEGEADE